MEPMPAKANQREGEGPGRGRHHLGQGRKSHLASTLPPGSSVPRFFLSFVATCLRVGPNDQFLEGKRRFREFGPRIWQKHQWSRLEAQPGVHMCPNCGHMTWLCYVGISAAITLEQAFHFRTERKRKGDNPARRVLWAACLQPCCQHLDLAGMGTDTPAFLSDTGEGLWRWKSLNISILILLN